MRRTAPLTFSRFRGRSSDRGDLEAGLQLIVDTALRVESLTLAGPFWIALAGFCVVAFGGAAPAKAADQNLAQWTVAFVNHDFNDRWATSMQAEIRFADDSGLDEFISKPAGYFKITKRLHLGVGYKHILRGSGADENDAWQEVYYTHPLGRFRLTHQVRLEERFVNGIRGTIPRLRYLIEMKYPLDASKYLVASEAARFNLVDKHEGPVEGFEQNRLFVGMGFHFGEFTRIEAGYLWRYERKRGGTDKSDHVIRLLFLFTTASPHPARGWN